MIHPPESFDEPTTFQHQAIKGVQQQIPCPPAQCAYQEFMGGVDLANQFSRASQWYGNQAKSEKSPSIMGLRCVC